MYRDVVAALATRHGKRAALAAPLRRRLGLRLRVADVDTDVLGTFTGEVPRPGPPAEVVVAKARLGMTATGLPVGLASEGSFGPHPAVPWVASDVEYVCLLDDRIGLTLVEAVSTVDTNHADLVCARTDRSAVLGFARRVGLPGHALVVAPASLGATPATTPGPGRRGAPEVTPRAGSGAVTKGVTRVRDLLAAVAVAADADPDGRVRLAADLRAHTNPTRMRAIAAAGVRLAARLATACPGCGGPGFGTVATRPGLPCRDCDTPTGLVGVVVQGCALCPYQRERRPAPGWADPAYCPDCNP